MRETALSLGTCHHPGGAPSGPRRRVAPQGQPSAETPCHVPDVLAVVWPSHGLSCAGKPDNGEV